MPTLGDLLVKIGVTGLSDFQSDLTSASNSINRIVNDADKSFRGFDKLGSVLTSAGQSLTLGLTVPLLGAGAAALKTAGDFDQTLAKITAFGDISGASLQKLRDQALKLGADTQFSAQQAADGMAVFASAGFNAEQIYAAMPGTLALAAAGQLAIGDAATITKDILGQFGLAAQDSGHVADVLAKASADASSSLAEMATTLTYAGPVAKGAGQSLEETTAAILALDAAGIRGEKAGTGLRGVIGSLLDPSKEAAKILGDGPGGLGISISDTTGHIRPLSDIMEQFKQKLSTVGTEAEKQKDIFQVFGREAGNAAQILINTGGPALDKFEKGLIGSAGAADKMAKTLNSGLNYFLDQLGGSIETAGIALGEVLMPAAKTALEGLTGLINGAILPAIKFFSELPDPLKYTALGMVGLAAAIGPVLLVAGTLASSIVSVSEAIVVARGVIAAFPAVFDSGFIGPMTRGQTLLTGFGGGLATFGLLGIAAFAGWGIGSWLANLELVPPTVTELEKKAAELGVTMDRGKRSADEWGTALAGAIQKTQEQMGAQGGGIPIERRIAALEEAAKKLGIEIAAGGNKNAEYLASLEKLVHGADSSTISLMAAGKAAASHGQETVKATIATQAFMKGQQDANAELNNAQAVYSNVQKLAKEGAASQSDVAAALKAVQSAAAKAHPELTATGVAHTKASDAAKDHRKSTDILTVSLRDAERDLSEVQKAERLGVASTDQVAAAQQRVTNIMRLQHPEWVGHKGDTEAAAKAEADLAAAIQVVVVSAGPLINTVGDLADIAKRVPAPISAAAQAMHDLGITSSADLKKVSDAAHDSYEAIKSDSKSTTGEIEAAWRKSTEAQRDYAKSIGDNTLAAALDKQLEAHKGNSTKVQGIWQDTVKQVSTIISDMGKSFAGGIIKLFDNSANDKLDEQAAQLQKELSKQTGLYQEHVAKVTSELGAIPQAYADALAELDGVTDGSLSKLASGFDAAMAKLNDGESSKLSDLAESYAAFVKDANESADLTTKHNKESLDKQLADLQGSLADRLKAYSRQTEDIATKRRNDREDAKRKLDDAKRDYDHYVQDQQLSLRALDGDTSASAQRQRNAILLNLQQRAEDYNDTVDDIGFALQRQEADLDESLTRQLQDYEQQKQEIAQKQIEAVATFKEKQDEQNAALAEKLAEREVEYKKDRDAAVANYELQKTELIAKTDEQKAAIIASYEDQRAKIVEKYEGQTASLQAELDKAKAEYDTYKTDLDSKLKAIEDAHKGPLGRIGDMFTGIFSSAGEALLRFAGEEVMGKLFGQLDKLLAKIPGLGGLGTIFGNAGSAAGTAVGGSGGVLGTGVGAAGSAGTSAAGSVGSSGSSAAGSASSTLGNVASGVGIVTGIVSAGADVFNAATLTNIKDCLNDMRNDTKFNSWVWDAGGMHQNLLLLGSNIDNFVNGSFGGWFHDALASLMTTVEDMKTDVSFNTFWALDALQDIKAATRFDVVPGLASITAAVTGNKPSININISGNVIGNQAFIDDLKLQLSQQLALQG